MKYVKLLSFLLLFSFFIILNSSTVSALPIPEPGYCGDGFCDDGETQSSCCIDCGCPSGKACIGGVCLDTTKYVCKDTSCTGYPYHYTTVTAAINAASAGDTVMITDSNTYPEDVTITNKQRITLTSNAVSPLNRPIIQSINSGNGVIDIKGSVDIIIRNIRVDQYTTLTSRSAINILSSTPSNSKISIINNTINTGSHTGNHGIYTNTECINCNFSYNQITTGYSSSRGMHLYQFSNGNITGNRISTTGSDSYGIYHWSTSGSFKNNIISNTITTSGNNGYGIYTIPTLYSTLEHNIRGNIITTYGSYSDGIYFDRSSNSHNNNNNITGNIITTYSSYSMGINFCCWGSYNNNVTDNYITTYSSDSRGISFHYSSNGNITGNRISTSGSGSVGIQMQPWNAFAADQTNNIINNNDISTGGSGSAGINVFRFSNGNITNNTIRTNCDSCHGIDLYSQLNDNNLITDNYLNTGSYSSSYGISISGSTNNKVINTQIWSYRNEVYLKGGALGEVNYLINCTLNKKNVTTESWTTSMKLFNQYYVGVYVNNSTGSPVASASVVGNDTNAVANIENPTSSFSDYTDDNGLIPRRILTEFMANGNYRNGNYLYFTNYTINASKIGYCSASKSLNLTQTGSTTVTLTLIAVCGRYVELSIKPTFAMPSSYVSPSAYGLSPSCEGRTVYFANDTYCPLKSRVSNCTVTSSPPFSTSGCVGNSFSLPPAAGPYIYYACIDTNCDDDFKDPGETFSLIYTVGYSSLPEFGWMGIVQIMILASAIILLVRKNQN